MGQKFYTRVFSKDIKKKIIFNKTNLFEYFLMKKVNVIVDSRSFFFQKLLKSYWDQFSIRFNKIQHQKLIVRNNATTYVSSLSHSWKSDSILLESVEIACFLDCFRIR